MSRIPLVVGNWKMNGSRNSLRRLAEGVPGALPQGRGPL